MWTAILLLDRALAIEVCNGLDDDGDGRVDEGPVAVGVDADRDGYATSDALAWGCDAGTLPAGDCDDTNPTWFPNPANEACNGSDGNCDGIVDDTTCPCPVVTTESKAWVVCDAAAVPWSTAVGACGALPPYHLASNASQTSQDQLVQALATFPVEFWIGLNDRTTEGTWVWSDGSPYGYRNWRAGEPNDNGPGAGEDCGEIEPTGLWDDQPCEQLQPYVCETSCATRTWYHDGDGDGLGDPSGPIALGCGRHGPEWSLVPLDCDDGRADLPMAGFVDDDGDGVGTVPLVACAALAVVDGDCDDGDDHVAPDQPEVTCNGIDDDCDPDSDDAPDSDGDGASACADCDDADPEVFPGAVDPEGDGVDQDCDGLGAGPLDRDGDGLIDDDEGTEDLDGDGLPNDLDVDSDGDGALDAAEGLPAAWDDGARPRGAHRPPAPDYGFGCAGCRHGGPAAPGVFPFAALWALSRRTGSRGRSARARP